MDFAISLLISDAESTIKSGEYVYWLLKPEEDANLKKLLPQLHEYAKDTAVKFRNDLIEIRRDLPNWGVNMTRTIEEAENDTFWYDLSKKSALKRARQKIEAAEREFRSISEDASSILICFEKQHNIRDALQKIRKDTPEPSPPTPPSISDRLNKLIERAEEVVKRFESRRYPSTR